MSGAKNIHFLVSITIDLDGSKHNQKIEFLDAQEQGEHIDVPASFRTDFANDPVISSAREILSGEVTSGSSYDLLDTKIFADTLASRFGIQLYGRQIGALLKQIGMHRLGKYRDGSVIKTLYSENPSKYLFGDRINPRAIRNALHR